MPGDMRLRRQEQAAGSMVIVPSTEYLALGQAADGKLSSSSPRGSGTSAGPVLRGAPEFGANPSIAHSHSQSQHAFSNAVAATPACNHGQVRATSDCAQLRNRTRYVCNSSLAAHPRSSSRVLVPRLRRRRSAAAPAHRGQAGRPAATRCEEERKRAIMLAAQVAELGLAKPWFL